MAPWKADGAQSRTGKLPRKADFIFGNRSCLAGSCRIPQWTPLTGSKRLPSFQRGFEGNARKIEHRRKSDTSLSDTKEEGKNGISAVKPQAHPSLGLGKGHDSKDSALMDPSPQIHPSAAGHARINGWA